MLVSGLWLVEPTEPVPRRDTGFKKMAILVLPSIEYQVSSILSLMAQIFIFQSSFPA
jgi:hypothetical protein